MKNLQSIEELKIAQQTEIARLEKLHIDHAAIYAAVPDVTKISPYFCWGDYSVTVASVGEVFEALQVAGGFTVEPLHKFDAGCCALIPDYFKTTYENKNKGATSKEINSHVYRIKSNFRGGSDKTFSFFVLLDNGLRLEINIPVTGDENTHVTHRREEYRGGFRIKEVTLHHALQDVFSDKLKWYAGEESINDFTLYDEI